MSFKSVVSEYIKKNYELRDFKYYIKMALFPIFQFAFSGRCIKENTGLYISPHYLFLQRDDERKTVKKLQAV